MEGNKLIKFLLLIMSLFVLAACNNSNGSRGSGDVNQNTGETGILTLKVNPEIQIEYNEDELVTGVSGVNDQGIEIVSHYYDFIGKESGEVLEELVHEIYHAGYLINETEDTTKNIVVEIESGSIIPSEDYLTKMSENIQTAIVELDLLRKEDPEISLEEAKIIALEEAGLKKEDVIFTNENYAEDDITTYEIRFTAENKEYRFDIDAQTTDILKQESVEQKTSSKQEKQNEKVQQVKNDRKKDETATKHQAQKGSSERESKAEQTESVPESETNQKAKEKSKSQKPNSESETKIEQNSESEKESTVQSESKEKSGSDRLSLERAKEIVLSRAGLSGANVNYDETEFDYDDGIAVYEIEFYYGGMEYEVEINADTGEILDFERDDD